MGDLSAKRLADLELTGLGRLEQVRRVAADGEPPSLTVLAR
jgi:hypothetical protein